MEEWGAAFYPDGDMMERDQHGRNVLGVCIISAQECFVDPRLVEVRDLQGVSGKGRRAYGDEEGKNVI